MSEASSEGGFTLEESTAWLLSGMRSYDTYYSLAVVASPLAFNEGVS